MRAQRVSRKSQHAERTQLAEDDATFTATRVERMLGIVLSCAWILIGAQLVSAGLPTLGTDGMWNARLFFLLLALLLVLIVTGFIGVGWRLSSIVFAVAFPAALLAWGITTTPASGHDYQQPWVWYLVTTATVSGVAAFTRVWGLIWTIVVPLEFLVIRMLPAGQSDARLMTNVGDFSFALCFGLVLFMLAWVFRDTAAGVDAARNTAVLEAGRVAASEAKEQERLETNALMHDSVLSALIAAERAESPREKELAVGMARDALTGLADAEDPVGAGADERESVHRIAEEMERAAAAHGYSLLVPVPSGIELPGRVVRALGLAGAQAVVNAIVHADAKGLQVSVAATQDSCRVTVKDAGPGIDVLRVPGDRLGLRGSVFARIAAVDGHAQLFTTERGTTIVLEWPWSE